MRCKKAGKFLALFVGGDLPTENVRTLEEHLENCPNCARELESLRRTQEILKTFASESKPTLGANYWLEILQRIEALDEREQWQNGKRAKRQLPLCPFASLHLRPVVALCSACLVFILAIFIFFSRFQVPQSENFRSLRDSGNFRWSAVKPGAFPREILTRKKEAQIAISSIVPAHIAVSLPINFGGELVTKLQFSHPDFRPHPRPLSYEERGGGEVETKYPLVEDVSKLNGTVMVFKTENPKIDIVWIFSEENL
ncbi:zf-HC2 domain-containing protein [Candidatus Poribacteria bacterium]|nr:zf-HC2 domain-containing protein [Candidatus Poribacteria bacterium]